MTTEAASRERRHISLANVLMIVTGSVAAYCAWRYDWDDVQAPPSLPFWVGVIGGLLILSGLRHVLIPNLGEFERALMSRVSRHRVMLPRQGIVYLVMMVVLATGSLLGHSNMLMLVFAMMAGPFVLNGWIVFTMLKRTEIERHLPDRLMVGQTGTVEIDLHNHKRVMSSRLMLAEDRLRNEDESLTGHVLFVRVPPRSTRAGRYTIRPMQRGHYTFGPLLLMSSFPLGLGQRGMLFPKQERVLVHPRVGLLSRQWKRQQLDAALLVQQPRHRQGTYDDEFHRIREFREGDNPRRIHWRSSARRSELMVKEFHQNREYDLSVLLDLWAPSLPRRVDRERVELAVSFAASVCVDHLRTCRDSGLSLFLPQEVQSLLNVSSSEATIEAVLDRLALVQAAPQLDWLDLIQQWSSYRSPRTRNVLVTTRPNFETLWRQRLDNGEAGFGGDEGVRDLQIVYADWSVLSDVLILDR